MVDFNPIDVPGLEPDPIRRAAGGFRTVAMQIVENGEKIPTATGRAAHDFSGDFGGRIKTRGEQSRTATQTTAFMNIYGAGITDHWAQNVADFKRRRQELIDEFEDAQARNFGVRTADYRGQDWEGFSTAREQAGQKLVAILNGRAQANYQQLMAHADQRGEELKQPPNARTLRGLLGDGYLLPGLSRPDLTTLMNQLKNTVPAGPILTLPRGFGVFGGMPVFTTEQGGDDNGPTTGAGDEGQEGGEGQGGGERPELPYNIERGPDGKPHVTWKPTQPTENPPPDPYPIGQPGPRPTHSQGPEEPTGQIPDPEDQADWERRFPPEGITRPSPNTDTWAGRLGAILGILLPNPPSHR